MASCRGSIGVASGQAKEAMLRQLSAAKEMLLKIPAGMTAARTAASGAQRAKLCGILSARSWDPVDAQELVEKCLETPFAEEDLEAIIVAITSRSDADASHSGGGSASGSVEEGKSGSKFQDWEFFYMYLAATKWHAIQNDKISMFEIIVEFLIALGLVKPSERTFQKIAALCMLVSEGRERVSSFSGASLLEVVNSVKRLFRGRKQGWPTVYVATLPMNPAVMKEMAPAQWDRAYGDESPAPCPYSGVDIAAVASSMPCRGRRNLPDPRTALQACQDAQGGGLMQMANAMMTQMAQMQRDQRKLFEFVMSGGDRRTLQDDDPQNDSPQLPGFSMLTPRSKASPGHCSSFVA